MNSLGLQTYVELFHFPSLAQSNVFNLTYMKSDHVMKRLKHNRKTYDILVAFFRPVSDPIASKYAFSIHHFDVEDRIIQPITKTIDFAYLPGASDIVCINALHDELTDEYFVAIGFVKEGEKGYLNIYRSKSEEKLPENCLSYSKLPCAPLHLTHAYCLVKDEHQWAFFLSYGEPFSDNLNENKTSNQPQVRIFSKLIDINIFEQVETNEDPKPSELNQSQTSHSTTAYGELSFNTAMVLFPELTKLPTTSIFLHMDFKIINNLRLSAFGSQDGWFGLFVVDMQSRTTIRHFNLSHESPITCIKIFQQFSGLNLASQDVIKNDEDVSILKKDVNCLVCSAFEPTVVYCNLFKNNGFNVANQLILPFSTDFDHVNCASVDDFNLDGSNEILLGTFGQRLLYYEWESSSSSSNTENIKNGQYILKAQRSLPGPVFCISPALDLIGEGSLSLAILTSRGLHIFQHDTNCLIKEIHHRLDNHLISVNK
ncbi:unnamed protein product [Schistosoma turkestanicum]|nr:unnamed protein product [Schistosoma turkestanicum]